MSFRLKTILGIALIELILLAVLIASGIGWLRDSNEQQIIASGERLSQTFAIAVRDAIISTDLANLRAFTRDAVGNADVVYLRIKDDRGQVLAQTSLLPEDAPPPNYEQPPSQAEDGIYDVFSEVVIDDFSVGQIEVGLDVSAFSQLLFTAKRYAVSLAVLEIALVALFSFIFGTLLTKQLLQLQQGASKIQQNGPGETVPVKGHDEIAQVAEAFNSMSIALSHSYQEISWEKDRYKQLAAQNQLLAALVEQSQEAFLITDLSGVVSNANQALYRLTGYTEQVAAGIHFQTLLFGEHATEEAAYRLSEAIEQKKPLNLRATCLSRSNHAIHTDITLFPILSGKGDVERFALIIRDVREHHEFEQKLREAADLATAATRAKSEFLVNMSHAIRTPMNGIMGLSDLLNASPLSKEQAEFTAMIHHSARELLQLMNDLLDFSKLEASKLRLQEAPFNLRDVIEETATLASLSAAEKELLVIIDLPPDLNTNVVGDEVRVKQVLYNLVSNAVKFTQHGYVKIVLRTANTGDDTLSGFEISVEDTGSGMTAETIARVTRPFEDEHDSDTHHYRGVGLGLAITCSLLTLLNSKLQVESDVGKGSKFSFCIAFPFAVPAPDYAGVLAGRNIAVVNADPLHRALLERYLTHWQATPTYINHLDHPSLRTDTFDMVLVIASELTDLQPAPAQPWVGIVAKMSQLNLAQSTPNQTLLAKPLRMRQLLDALLSSMQTTSSPTLVAAQPISTTRTMIENLSIAVVDDAPFDLELLRLYLKDITDKVHYFANATDAVAHYRREAFDILVTDVAMPQMNGYELTQRIRKFEAEHGLPPCSIIGVSAHASEDNQTQALEAGMDEYLTKPLSKDTLLTLLARIATHRLSLLTDG